MRINKVRQEKMDYKKNERNIREMESLASLVEYEYTLFEDIDEPSEDLRPLREITAKSLIKFFRKGNLLGLYPPIIMKQKSGKPFRCLEGWTRIPEFKAQGFKGCKCLIIPNTSEGLQLLISITSNFRVQLEDGEKMRMWSKLKEIENLTDKEVAEWLEYSESHVKRFTGIKSYPIEIQKMVEKQELKQYQVEDGLQPVFESDKIGPPERKEAILIGGAKCIVAEVKKREKEGKKYPRSHLRESKFGELLRTNVEVMPLDTPIKELIKSASKLPCSRGKKGSDMKLEHPAKLIAFEKLLQEIKPEFVRVLYSDAPKLYDTERKEYPTHALIASKYVGKKNVIMVGLGEGIKKDKADELGLNYKPMTVAVYLASLKNTINQKKGIIVVDGFGIPLEHSFPFFYQLYERFPNSYFLVLVQNQFYNGRNWDLENLLHEMLYRWGINYIPYSLEHYREIWAKWFNTRVDIYWEEDDKKGQPVSYFLMHPRGKQHERTLRSNISY